MYINYKFLQVLLTIVLSTLSTPRLWDLLIALNRIETKIEKAKGKKTTKIVQQSATMTHRTRYELSYVTCQKILLVFFFCRFFSKPITYYTLDHDSLFSFSFDETVVDN